MASAGDREGGGQVTAAELALESVDEVTEGRAQVLDQQSENELAEAARRANYGVGRKLYVGASEAVGINTVYLEVAAA